MIQFSVREGLNEHLFELHAGVDTETILILQCRNFNCSSCRCLYRLHYEDHIDNNFQWTLEYLMMKCGMWSPEKTGFFETQTKGSQEATVLLFLAYNNSTTNDLEGLKCHQKIRTIGAKQVPQVSRYLYTAIYIIVDD